jgi:hypothetical protein
VISGCLRLVASIFSGGRLRSVPCALFPLALVSACTGLHAVSEKTGSTACANLSVLIDAELADDRDWTVLSSRRKNAQARADELSAGAAILPADRNLFRELDDIARQETRVRKKVYPAVYAAVKAVAKRKKYDFVLTMDDSLLYSESRFDITGEILQELKTIRARSDPLVR